MAAVNQQQPAMDAQRPLTFRWERTAVLIQVIQDLDHIIDTTTHLWIVDDAEDLIRAARGCVASAADAANHRVLRDIRRDAWNHFRNACRAEAYRHFIRRLRNADAGNLIGRYMPDRPWDQEYARDCLNGAPYPPVEGLPTDPRFLWPLASIWEAYVDEGKQYILWLRQGLVGAPAPQPWRIWNDFFTKLAKYSEEFDAPDRQWTFQRIVSCLGEAYKRCVLGNQANYRQLLRYGWRFTEETIRQDAATAHWRVEGMLSQRWEQDLVEAVFLDAAYHYFEDVFFTRPDPSASRLSSRPRGWVWQGLLSTPQVRVPPEPTAIQAVTQILGCLNAFGYSTVDTDLNVWMKCRFVGMGRGEWCPVLIGRDDGSDRDLDRALRVNQRAWAVFLAYAAHSGVPPFSSLPVSPRTASPRPASPPLPG